MPDFIRQGHPLMRLAGLSGAAAVALGAYGAHGMLHQIFGFKFNMLIQIGQS